MRPVRVALSNDYEVVLRGLASMLADHPDRVEVVDLSASVELASEADVILYDTFGRLPQDDGKLRDVVGRNDAKVVVYSWDSYPEHVARANGAAGYLHKGLSGADLADAIVAVHRGEAVTVGHTSGEDDEMPTWPGKELGLSARESEVLTFIARGLRNEEIAQQSFLSINTIKTYVRTAYRKIGVDSRAQAVAWALRHGFLPD